MEIKPTIGKPGMFCLVLNDGGVKTSKYFTKIETISKKRDENATLCNGLERGQDIEISPEAIDSFYDQVCELGIPVFITCPSLAKEGTPIKDIAA